MGLYRQKLKVKERVEEKVRVRTGRDRLCSPIVPLNFARAPGTGIGRRQIGTRL